MLLAIKAISPLPLCAAPTPPQAKTEDKTEVLPPTSKFVIPNNPSEGRDPFFTDSKRLFSANSGKENHGPDLTDLVLKSIMGTPPNAFAIINNHTFASGDDGDITTKSGQRLHVTCVEVSPRDGTVTIEAGGTRIVLRLQGGL